MEFYDRTRKKMAFNTGGCLIEVGRVQNIKYSENCKQNLIP
jgi:hypothetical protein